MIRILVVSHSSLASSLVSTVKMIGGEALVEGISSIAIEDGQNGIVMFEQQVLDYMSQHAKDSFLLLCDIACATPFNVCLSVFRSAVYEVVTGVNLPMLLEVALKKEHATLEDLAMYAKNAGKEGVETYTLKATVSEVECEDIL